MLIDFFYVRGRTCIYYCSIMIAALVAYWGCISQYVHCIQAFPNVSILRRYTIMPTSRHQTEFKLICRAQNSITFIGYKARMWRLLPPTVYALINFASRKARAKLPIADNADLSLHLKDLDWDSICYGSEKLRWKIWH